MRILILSSILISFFLSIIFIPKWIKKCQYIGLTWEDMNKFKRPKDVAASGGVVVVMSFVFGVLSYVAIRTYVFKIDGVNTEIFSLLSVILILSIVGLVDDLLGWRHGGLSARFRVILAIFASIPLVVINSGASNIMIPFFGQLDIGIFYPLIFIPIGVAGATTTYNFLAGFNGIESGQGIIILSYLSFIAYITGTEWLAIVGLCMAASLVVFFYFNKFPSKVFPGDILTYSIGALIAGMAILGNFERIAVFVFIPYIIETLLKLRGRLKKQSFAKPKPDGSLEMPYNKIYGLTHLSLYILKKFKKKVYERDVVYLIFIFQIIICLISIVVFRSSIF